MSLTDNQDEFKSGFTDNTEHRGLSSDAAVPKARKAGTTRFEPAANVGSVSRDESSAMFSGSKFIVSDNAANKIEGTCNEIAEPEQPSARTSDGNASQQDNETNEPGKNKIVKYNCLVPKEMWSQKMIDLYAQQKKTLKEWTTTKDKRMLIRHRRINAKFKYLFKQLKKKIFQSDRFDEIQELAKISKEKEKRERCERESENIQRHFVNKAKLAVLGPNFIEHYVSRGYKLQSYIRDSEQFKEFLRRYSLDSCDPKVVPKLINRLKESGELHLLEHKARYNYLKHGRSSNPTQRSRSPLDKNRSSSSRNNSHRKDYSPEQSKRRHECRSRSNSPDNSSASPVASGKPEHASENSSKLSSETVIKSLPSLSLDIEKLNDRPRLPSLLEDIVQLRESVGDNTKPASLPKGPSSSTCSDTQQQPVNSGELSTQAPEVDAPDSSRSSPQEKSSQSSTSQNSKKPGDSTVKQSFRPLLHGSRHQMPYTGRNYNVNVSCNLNFSMTAGYHMNGSGYGNNPYNQGFGMGNPCVPYGSPDDCGYYGGYSGHPYLYPGPSNYSGANEMYHQNSQRYYPSTKMYYPGPQGSYSGHKGRYEDQHTKSKYKMNSSRDSNKDSRKHHSSHNRKSRHSPKHGGSASSSSRHRYK